MRERKKGLNSKNQDRRGKKDRGTFSAWAGSRFGKVIYELNDEILREDSQQRPFFDNATITNKITVARSLETDYLSSKFNQGGLFKFGSLDRDLS